MSATTPDAAGTQQPGSAPRARDERLTEYFRALVQTLPDATMVLDRELVLRDQTPSATALLGRDIAAQQRTSFLSIIHPEDRPAATAVSLPRDGAPGYDSSRPSGG